MLFHHFSYNNVNSHNTTNIGVVTNNVNNGTSSATSVTKNNPPNIVNVYWEIIYIYVRKWEFEIIDRVEWNGWWEMVVKNLRN